MPRMFEHWPKMYFQVAGVAFLIAVFLMPLAMAVLRRLGVVDPVSARKIHTKPVVRGGGIVIFCAYAGAVLYSLDYSHPLKGILIGGFICLLVGALDDILGGVPAVLKLATLIVVTIVLAHYGVHLKVFRFFPLDLVVTLIWIVGITSAFNGIDNMDGLASGTTVIVSAMFLFIAVQAFLVVRTDTNLWWFGILAAALIGSNLGFLVYNVHPARVFMGDSGSFFLGFTLAALGVMGEWNDNRIIACVIPVLILAVPIFDFAYIIVARILRGETRSVRAVIEHCAPDHLSHRLTWLGFSQRKAVAIIYLMSLALGISGILLRNSESLVDLTLALFQGLLIVTIIIVLMAAGARAHARAEAQPKAEMTPQKPLQKPEPANYIAPK